MTTTTKAELLAQATALGLTVPAKATKATIAALIADAAEPTVVSQAAQLARYKGGYEATVSSSGNASLHNGDDVALTLSGTTPAAIVTAAELLLGLEAGSLTERYANLNEGQRRMNAGNRIRGAHKRGDVTCDQIAAAIAAV